MRPRLVRWLSAGTAGAGAAAVYWAVHTSTGESRHLGLTLCFAVMLAGLQLAPTWLVQEGAAEGLRVEDALFVPMAMLLLPTEALLALA
ncbi:MAG TPA: hypothetical protein VGR90_10390, partial [Acidimicrobiales bacterium]|nr:hypothetical protein [Acidimicrobiales bacterium]